MSAHWFALLLAAMYVTGLAGTALRFLRSRSLDEYSADVPVESPLLSVIIPARDEARNIERSLRSVIASTWPALEVIVVDDHSTDGTGEIARRIAATATNTSVTVNASRPTERVFRQVSVIDAPPLPAGWFGKQWACHAAAQSARGEYLCFTDADTAHGAELLARSVRAMQERRASLLTIAGYQELGSFWEKVVQPVIFASLFTRFGGLEKMNESKDPKHKIANGQFLLFPRAEYDRVGGHEGVREYVAEDLMLAQRVAAAGGAAHMLLGLGHLRTRMYTSLTEIRRGWVKNVFVAALDTITLGPVGRRLFAVVLPFAPLITLVPLLALALGLSGVLGEGATWFGAITAPVNLLYWMGVYIVGRYNPIWALFHPLGALVFSWICGEAAWRGTSVSWKGRDYEVGGGTWEMGGGAP